MKKRTSELEVIQMADLHPTQISVGMDEVARRRDLWRRGGASSLDSQRGPVLPIVRGPFGQSYLIDHHHRARALIEEGVEPIFTTPVADFSRLRGEGFWRGCKERGSCHSFDAEGRHQHFTAVPATIVGLTDGPFRSVALREAGLPALSEEAHGVPGWKPSQPAPADFARHRSVQNATT